MVALRKLSLRYGFLSDFTMKDGVSDEDISFMRKLHINMVQFYDWSYRHDNFVSPTENYQDMMGKDISINTVKSKIQKALSAGMLPMAYGAVYAASKEFFEAHRDWGLYTGTNEVLRFIDKFYIMNIAKDCPWHDHIIEQYKKAVKDIGFKGIHMDTYGFPKTAYSHNNGEIRKIKLEEEFGDLINDVKNSLNEVDPDNYIVFNNVGNWPVLPVADTKQDAIYIEVWKPYERYFHIKQIIREAKSACSKEKTVILAAYLSPFRLEDIKSAGYAMLLLTAVIVTNGGYHLLLGEENGVLTQGYYGDYSTLLPVQIKSIRSYYDFMIRFMNLFYDDRMTDVSMTHIGWDNYEYQCGFSKWSCYGEADKIWLTIRENDNFKTISLINLCGCKDDYWNKGKDKPIPQHNIEFCVHVDQKIKGIYYASPDEDSTKIQVLDYTYQITDKGRFVCFTVKELCIWTFVYIEI